MTNKSSKTPAKDMLIATKIQRIADLKAEFASYGGARGAQSKMARAYGISRERIRQLLHGKYT